MERGFESEWRARFDRFAARGGSDALISGWSEHGLQRRLALLVPEVLRLDYPKGSKVLDLGCGSGIYLRHLEEHGYAPFGADYALGMVRRAKENCAAAVERGAIRLLAADVYALPFRDAVFPVLINVGVLQHLADERTALVSMARTVVPGGRLLVDTLNRFSLHAAAALARDVVRAWLKGRLWPKRHAVRRRPTRLAAVGASLGLVAERVKGIYILPRLLRFLEPVLDALDRVRWPFSLCPVLLPFANTFLIIFRKESTPR